MSVLWQHVRFYLVRSVPILIVGAFLGSMALIMLQAAEPLLAPLHLLQGEARLVDEGVIIGPYPRERDLLVLKQRLGVSEVISLLDPSLPMEGTLLREEKHLAARLGLAFRNVPVSYLKLDDPATRERVRRLAVEVRDRGPGRVVYVHCYLGRHRVGMFEHILAALPPAGD